MHGWKNQTHFSKEQARSLIHLQAGPCLRVRCALTEDTGYRVLLHPIDRDSRGWEASSSSHIRMRPILFRILAKQVNTVRPGTFGKWTSFFTWTEPGWSTKQRQEQEGCGREPVAEGCQVVLILEGIMSCRQRAELP